LSGGESISDRDYRLLMESVLLDGDVDNADSAPQRSEKIKPIPNSEFIFSTEIG
jgi:hypothetical protein